MSARIAAVVVTYNRKELLARCLDALLSQTRPPDRIYIVDNASTDGTGSFLSERGYSARGSVECVKLSENIGGAGGFSEGLGRAVSGEYDWVWMMDDDAEPDRAALAALEDAGLDGRFCYGSCAVFAGGNETDYLCWPAVEAGGEGEDRPRRIRRHGNLPKTMTVTGLPFLGFLVSRRMAEAVGLPDGGYFVSGDDMDYSERLKSGGARLILVRESILRHPRPNDYTVRLLGRDFFCLRMPPWRRYYDIRNRLINGRRHHGLGLWFMTLPGVLVRWGATLLREPERLRQSRAYTRGMIDGLMGRLGKRWEPGT